MAEHYISKLDIEVINQILARDKNVLIKKERDVLKICEQGIKVAKKKRLNCG